MDQDEQHLELLRTFHFVVAAIQAVFGCFPLIHLTVGVVMVATPEKLGPGHPPPAFFGWIFIAIAVVLIAMMWTMAALTLVAGRRLGQRRSYTFCLVVAGLLCMFMPVGTVLGVFTIVVLLRPTVKARFTG